jgi:hypothetical protein
MKTAYPTATDIENFIEAGGITTTAGQQAFFASAALAGKQIIEQRTGRVFLGDGTNTTRYYEPPTTRSGRLYIDDLASLSTVTYQPSGQATATSWTLNTDYWVEPDNYAAKGLPITSLILRQGWSQPLSGTYRRSVIVTGQWGYATLAAGFPDAVWLAMLAAGCVAVYGSIAQALTGGMLGWKEADVQEDYGVEPLKRLRDSWAGIVETTVPLYRRMRI